MAHAQKPDLVFQSKGGVHLNRRGSQFSRLLAVEECRSAGRLWIDHVPRYSARVVATLSNRLFPLHFPSQASPCAITFRTASTALVETLTAMHGGIKSFTQKGWSFNSVESYHVSGRGGGRSYIYIYMCVCVCVRVCVMTYETIRI